MHVLYPDYAYTFADTDYITYCVMLHGEVKVALHTVLVTLSYGAVSEALSLNITRAVCDVSLDTVPLMSHSSSINQLYNAVLCGAAQLEQVTMNYQKLLRCLEHATD